MKNINNNSRPEITEPTEEEIKNTIEKVKNKYDIVISKDDAIKYTKLYNELSQWFMIEKNSKSPDSITDEMGKEIKSYLKQKRDQEVSPDEASRIAAASLKIVIPGEKERIANEIRAIIAKYN